MKKITITIALLLPLLCATASPTLPPDTTFQYKNRTVVIKDSNGEFNVSVFRKNAQNQSVENKKIYEGIFTEKQEIERVYDNNFEICPPKIFQPKDKQCSQREATAHLTGFGVGITGFSNRFLQHDGELPEMVDLNQTLRFQLYGFKTAYYIDNLRMSIISGLGVEWNIFRFQKNKWIAVEDYQATIKTLPTNEQLKKSKLNCLYTVFPFLIERNVSLGHGNHLFYNAGINIKWLLKGVSSIKTSDNERIKYKDNINISPLTMDFVVNAGVNDFGFFVGYSPFNTFRSNKGPQGKQFSFGVHFYF